MASASRDELTPWIRGKTRRVNPEGDVPTDTLRTLLAYRRPMATGAPPFGVYAKVVTPGTVRVGDVAALTRP